jgi:hypothetical protein
MEESMANEPRKNKFREWWRKSRRARRIAAIGGGVVFVLTRIGAAFEYVFRRWPLF